MNFKEINIHIQRTLIFFQLFVCILLCLVGEVVGSFFYLLWALVLYFYHLYLWNVRL